MPKTDAPPKFSNVTPPAPRAHVADKQNNLFLGFFHRVLNGQEENSKTVAATNKSKTVSSNEVTLAKENVVEAAGNFLAETSRGAATLGQNISSNAEATAALDKLFDAYEQYHNLLEASSTTAPSGTSSSSTIEQVPAETTPPPVQTKAATVFTPKTPAPATTTSNTPATTGTATSPATTGDSGTPAATTSTVKSETEPVKS